MYLFKKKRFTEHLLFSLNFYAFFLIFLMLVPVLMTPVQWCIRLFGIHNDIFASQNALVLMILISCFGYLSVAIRTVYRDKLGVCLVKAAILSVTVIVLIPVLKLANRSTFTHGSKYKLGNSC
jgi:hypothetical protein